MQRWKTVSVQPMLTINFLASGGYSANIACVRRCHGGKQISAASHRKRKKHNQYFVKADIWAHSLQSLLWKHKPDTTNAARLNQPHKIRNL